jgi:hypothetical protein
VNNEAPGCVMIPVLIVVVPLRLLWEVLAAIGRFTGAYLLRPLGLLLHVVLVRPLRWLLRVLVLVPLSWVAVTLLAPIGRFVRRYLLRPIGLALAWTIGLLLTPFVYAAEWIGRGLAALWPLVRPGLATLGRAVAAAWRAAGVVLFHLLVRPTVWMWRNLVMPVLRTLRRAWCAAVLPPARWLRAYGWEPARTAVRSARRAVGLDPRSR